MPAKKSPLPPPPAPPPPPPPHPLHLNGGIQVVGNLRRQLKESFGAPAPHTGVGEKDTLNPTGYQLQKDSLLKLSESSMIYNNASEMELNVDFLTDYAQRKDLNRC